MKKYSQLLKESFEFPILNNDKVLKSRESPPIELFFDLIFVAIFAVISHLFLHLTFDRFLLAYCIFSIVFSMWMNTNMFMMRFYNASYIIRIGVTVAMLPLFMISGLDDFYNPEQIKIFCIAIFLSKVIMILLWSLLSFKNPNVKNKSFIYGIKIDLIGFLMSAIIMLIPFFIPSNIVLLSALILNIILENFYLKIMYSKFVSPEHLNSDEMPKIDLKLFNERGLLFLILIFGEGIFTSLSTFHNIGGNYFMNLLLGILSFLAVIFFFFRIYEEAVIKEFLKKFTMPGLIYLNIVQFNVLSMYAVLNAILQEKEFVSINLRILLFVNLFIIGCLHFNSNLNSLKNDKLDDLERQFYIVDNRTIYTLVIISILTLFVKDKLYLVLLVLLYFIIHLIAIPYRYHIFKEKLKH